MIRAALLALTLLASTAGAQPVYVVVTGAEIAATRTTGGTSNYTEVSGILRSTGAGVGFAVHPRLDVESSGSFQVVRSGSTGADFQGGTIRTAVLARLTSRVFAGPVAGVTWYRFESGTKDYALTIGAVAGLDVPLSDRLSARLRLDASRNRTKAGITRATVAASAGIRITL